MCHLSIIVPCYNEEGSVPLFYGEVTDVLESASISYELLFINDGSRDATLTVLKDLAKKDAHVKYFSFARNFGKEAAMLAGFHHAAGEYVAVMDADLQDPPALLPDMIAFLDSGEYDSVATRRSTRKGEPVLRSWFARRFYGLINRFSDSDIVDGARDFRIMRREMVEAIVAMNEYNRFSKGIFGWIGFRTKWLSYENVERASGSTKWGFWKLVRYAIDGIISFSQAPLNIASWMGTIMTLLSAVAIVFIVVRRIFFGDPVAGWASTICVIVFIGGVQLMILGIIGQYLAKTYLETKKRPHYILAESNVENAKRIG